mmetsp:Transcript_17310/g.20067  ORF Transcript_17310/g.20067 Transcript_17310/m.20067 type:complete len:91 (+) Transcript_17310:164-436(+)
MWSIGIMTYYMLAGDPPFNNENNSELFDAIITSPVLYPKKTWQHVSSDCIDFVQKLLVKKPEDRLTAKEAILHPWFEFSNSLQRKESDAR